MLKDNEIDFINKSDVKLKKDIANRIKEYTIKKYTYEDKVNTYIVEYIEPLLKDLDKEKTIIFDSNIIELVKKYIYHETKESIGYSIFKYLYDEDYSNDWNFLFNDNKNAKNEFVGIVKDFLIKYYKKIDIKKVDKLDIVAVKQQMQQESEVFNTVLSNWEDDESPLKDTYQVKVKDVTKIGKTADQIKQINNVSVVRYGEGMVEKLVSAFDSIQKVTYGIVIALIIVTIFLIVNTIKLTISARKREISIMRLVGASNFTIKTPFIIEGMILGLFGSIIPIVISTYGYLAFYNHFNGYLFSELIQLIKPEPFMYTTALMVLGVGIVVGMIGSASAVKKYLKV